MIQPPGGARQRHEAERDEAAAEEDVGAALRAEDRHAIHELAHHHLGDPGQLQPYREGGELGGRQGERLPDPELVGDGDDAERARGEIDAQQRQIGETEAPERRQQRRLERAAGEAARAAVQC